MQVLQPQLRLLFWETTVGCNLKCIHCRATALEGRAPDELNTDEALGFVGALAAFAKPILVLSGGEPLYRPDIFRIAEFATEKGLKVARATNGTLVGAETARKTREAGIRRVSISLDGADAKTHDQFRGFPGSFDRALEGAWHLRQEKVSLQLNTTVARHNADQLPRVMEMAEEMGADALHLFLLVPVGCGLEIAGEQQIPAEEYERILNWFYEQSRHTRMELKATCAPHYYRIIRQRAREEGRKVTPKADGMAAMTRGCLAGSGVCFLSHKGEVFPCGYLPVRAGSIREQGIEEIWNSAQVFKEMRDPGLLEGRCGLCEYRMVCGGCRARAFGQTGNYLGEEPFCLYEPPAGARKKASREDASPVGQI